MSSKDAKTPNLDVEPDAATQPQDYYEPVLKSRAHATAAADKTVADIKKVTDGVAALMVNNGAAASTQPKPANTAPASLTK